MKTPHLQRGLMIISMSVVLAAVVFCGYKVHAVSGEAETIRRDYSTTNNIGFGILSVNRWRDLIVASVSRGIRNFSLTEAEKDSLEKEIAHLLNGLIDKGDSAMNAPKKTIGGKIQKLAYNMFVHKRSLHKMVPDLSRNLTDQMLEPGSKRRLRYLAQNKLEELSQDIYDSARDAQQKTLDSVYQRYGVNSDSAFQLYTERTLPVLQHAAYRYAYAIVIIVAFVLGLWFILRRQRQIHVVFYIMSIATALVLLVVGLTTPMIDIDARINSLSFELLGQTVTFKNQVIFFQSKSILDVVHILLFTGKADSIFVGILILAFSIIFPVAKLISTGVALLSQRKWAKNKFIHFFAFHSGKWSMADVTVVAIFMAYIGFNGIMESQMRYLNVHGDAFTSIATNKTALQPGYIIFVTFVVFGLALSEILKMITETKQSASPAASSAA